MHGVFPYRRLSPAVPLFAHFPRVRVSWFQPSKSQRMLEHKSGNIDAVQIFGDVGALPVEI